MVAFLNWRISRGDWATFDAVLSNTVERFLANVRPGRTAGILPGLRCPLARPLSRRAVRRGVIQCYLDDEALLLR